MSLLEKAYKTYESQKDIVGVEFEGEKPLIPVSHMLMNAQIEIFLDADGNFIKANTVENSPTIIPVTPESASRSGTGAKDRPHPLSDQLMYLSKGLGGNFDNYVKSLSDWANSEYSHPKVRAVLNYIKKETILSDLANYGVIDLEDLKKSDKKLVRWQVINTGKYDEAWRDTTLFDSYINWYDVQLSEGTKGICNITWKEEILAESHPKGVLAYANGAKLISSNDSTNFTYRGRFETPDQVAAIGYYSTQKAHNALRYLASNYGVRIGNRTFLWWKLSENEKVNPMLNFADFAGMYNGAQEKVIQFQRELRDTLSGKSNRIKLDGEMIVVALEAATTGRLSVTYYSELETADFAKRINHWYESMTYSEAGYTISLRRIINIAFGNERGEYIEADDRVLSEGVQRLLPCVIDCAALPKDIVVALVHKFGRPLAYKDEKNSKNLRYVQDTAFAVVKKYRNEKFKEEWNLALDTKCEDRSYLFGRLLAIAEKMEKDTYYEGEGRTTNAIKLQSAFSQHPMSTWKVLMEKLNPYREKLEKRGKGIFNYYDKIISEIMGSLNANDPMLNTGLSELYVLGYYHQKSELYKKHTDNSEN